MKEVKVLVNTLTKVKKFNNLVRNFDEQIDVQSGRYVIDAKSILGLYSVDLTKPMTMIIHTEDNARAVEIVRAFKEFVYV